MFMALHRLPRVVYHAMVYYLLWTQCECSIKKTIYDLYSSKIFTLSVYFLNLCLYPYLWVCQEYKYVILWYNKSNVRKVNFRHFPGMLQIPNLLWYYAIKRH